MSLSATATAPGAARSRGLHRRPSADVIMSLPGIGVRLGAELLAITAADRAQSVAGPALRVGGSGSRTA